MKDDEITAIVGWPTEPQMAKYRSVAAAAEAAERERCAAELEARARSWNGLVCNAMLTAAQAMRNGA